MLHGAVEDQVSRRIGSPTQDLLLLKKLHTHPSWSLVDSLLTRSCVILGAFAWVRRRHPFIKEKSDGISEVMSGSSFNFEHRMPSTRSYISSEARRRLKRDPVSELAGPLSEATLLEPVPLSDSRKIAALLGLPPRSPLGLKKNRSLRHHACFCGAISIEPALAPPESGTQRTDAFNSLSETVTSTNLRSTSYELDLLATAHGSLANERTWTCAGQENHCRNHLPWPSPLLAIRRRFLCAERSRVNTKLCS